MTGFESFACTARMDVHAMIPMRSMSERIVTACVIGRCLVESVRRIHRMG